MTIRKFALGGAAAVAFASLAGMSPASAFTHHPATPEEIQQTDALNAQSLANAQTAAPATQTTATAAPTTPSDAAPAAPMPLVSMASLPTLDNAAVQGSDGATVGTVKSVVTGSDGKPSMVDVALNDNTKVVALSANELSYDQAHNVLIAAMTDEQIKALPSAS